MNQCKCGKSYKHHTNLVRHQRGNTKQGIVPCKVYLDGLMEKVQENTLTHASELIQRYESLHETSVLKKAVPFEHDPQVIPTFAQEACKGIPHDPSVPLIDVICQKMGISELGGKLMSIIVESFKRIYMSKDHPEYWNVYLWNLNSNSVYVFKNGEWEDQPFQDWSDEFSKRLIARIIVNTEGTAVWIQCIQRLFEALAHSMKEIRQGLKSAMRNPSIRNRMKSMYH